MKSRLIKIFLVSALVFALSVPVVRAAFIMAGAGGAPTPFATYALDSNGNDSQVGSNDLTSDEAPSWSADYKEGSGSADFNASDDDLYRADGDLSAGFPLKNGDTSKVISVTMWIKSDTSTANRYLVAKAGQAGTEDDGFAVRYGSDRKIDIRIGWDDAAACDGNEIVEHATALTNGSWYHVGVAVDGVAKSYLIHITDEGGSTVGSDLSGSFTNEMCINDEAFAVGSQSDLGDVHDGHIDALNVFDEILTAAQMEEFR